MDAASPCSKVNHLRWDLSAQQIQALTKELIEQTKCVYDHVGAQDFEEVSYESTLKALADVEVTYTGELGKEWEPAGWPATRGRCNRWASGQASLQHGRIEPAQLSSPA